MTKHLQLLSLFLCVVSISYGQYTFDGTYSPCPPDVADEYADASAPDPQPNSGSSTCDVTEVYLDIYTDGGVDYFLLGMKHGNSGQSNFRLYVNTDCDATTGQTLAPENLGDPGTIPVGGADYYVNFTTSNNPSTDVFEWDGTQFVTSTSGDALTGDSCTASGDFVEVRIAIDDVFDPCANNSCGIIEVTTIISNAGGSANSNFCDNVGLTLPIPVNDPPTPNFTLDVICDLEQTPTADGFLPCVELTPVGDLDPNFDIGDTVTYQWSYFLNGSTTAGTLGSFTNESGINITAANQNTVASEFCPDPTELPGTYTFALTVVDTFDCDETATDESTQTVEFTVDLDFLDQTECNILPIELINFSGEFRSAKTVTLLWETASELNNEFFDVERRYAHQNEFISINRLNGSGTSSVPIQYSYTDNNVLFDDVFYRIKQIDFDGQFTYSNIIHLEKEIEENNLSVFNSSDGIVVNIETADENFAKNIQVYNIYGQLLEVRELGQNSAQQSHQVYIEKGKLSKGILFVSVTFSDGSRKVIQASQIE